MQLQKTVRKAKNVKVDMIIGVDRKFSYLLGYKTKRVWHKVQDVVQDNVRNVRYLVVRNQYGSLDFLRKGINESVPVKVHPNTKLHRAKK